ncbi:hypothetical protein H6G76_14890 [Nostoc sp. FACHB-152]|uniref:hypothetical protein n=1 Tax=unclassified Nostoc TaxID=2593658 RepID=UPI0016889CA6|nr:MULTISPECIES: hypothetical protein [unclassified Nostoc]MBD2448421.1 hypothetical protein [Nostoc sp. FACHB-152]MBD2470861.1 hypothetical protein [Nostoc sp. FACHB-145]
MTLGELWISDFELQANADNYPKSLVPIRMNQQLLFNNADGQGSALGRQCIAEVPSVVATVVGFADLKQLPCR